MEHLPGMTRPLVKDILVVDKPHDKFKVESNNYGCMDWRACSCSATSRMHAAFFAASFLLNVPSFFLQVACPVHLKKKNHAFEKYL